jgi:hypothetical protein
VNRRKEESTTITNQQRWDARCDATDAGDPHSLHSWLFEFDVPGGTPTEVELPAPAGNITAVVQEAEVIVFASVEAERPGPNHGGIKGGQPNTPRGFS